MDCGGADPCLARHGSLLLALGPAIAEALEQGQVGSSLARVLRVLLPDACTLSLHLRGSGTSITSFMDAGALRTEPAESIAASVLTGSEAFLDVRVFLGLDGSPTVAEGCPGATFHAVALPLFEDNSFDRLAHTVEAFADTDCPVVDLATTVWQLHADAADSSQASGNGFSASGSIVCTFTDTSDKKKRERRMLALAVVALAAAPYVLPEPGAPTAAAAGPEELSCSSAHKAKSHAILRPSPAVCASAEDATPRGAHPTAEPGVAVRHEGGAVPAWKLAGGSISGGSSISGSISSGGGSISGDGTGASSSFGASAAGSAGTAFAAPAGTHEGTGCTAQAATAAAVAAAAPPAGASESCGTACSSQQPNHEEHEGATASYAWPGRKGTASSESKGTASFDLKEAPTYIRVRRDWLMQYLDPVMERSYRCHVWHGIWKAHMTIVIINFVMWAVHAMLWAGTSGGYYVTAAAGVFLVPPRQTCQEFRLVAAQQAHAVASLVLAAVPGIERANWFYDNYGSIQVLLLLVRRLTSAAAGRFELGTPVVFAGTGVQIMSVALMLPFRVPHMVLAAAMVLVPAQALSLNRALVLSDMTMGTWAWLAAVSLGFMVESRSRRLFETQWARQQQQVSPLR